MSRKLIVLMGLDGSGKSSQAERLREHLESKGHRARVVWMRGESYVTRPILALGKAALRAPEESKKGEGATAGEAYTRYTASKRGMFRSTLLRAVWRTLAIIDLWLSVRIAFARLPRDTDVVILDRYIVDTFIDLDTAFGAGGREVGRLLASRVMGLFPRPRATFLLEIPPEEAMRRKDDIPSVAYLEERDGLYRRAAGMIGAFTLDATLPIDQVTAAIIERVKEVPH